MFGQQLELVYQVQNIQYRYLKDIVLLFYSMIIQSFMYQIVHLQYKLIFLIYLCGLLAKNSSFMLAVFIYGQFLYYSSSKSLYSIILIPTFIAPPAVSIETPQLGDHLQHLVHVKLVDLLVLHLHFYYCMLRFHSLFLFSLGFNHLGVQQLRLRSLVGTIIIS